MLVLYRYVSCDIADVVCFPIIRCQIRFLTNELYIDSCISTKLNGIDIGCFKVHVQDGKFKENSNDLMYDGLKSESNRTSVYRPFVIKAV